MNSQGVLKMIVTRLLAVPAIALVVFLAPHASAQDAANLVGHWTGTISEPRSQDFPTYTLSVHLGLDNHGAAVGVVDYSAFPCTGVWTNAANNGSTWRFEETITDGTTVCAQHGVIELTPRSSGIDVRLWPVGYESSPSTGRLVRRAP